jgi:hypothetical protein
LAAPDQPGPLGVRNAALGTVRTVGPSEVLLMNMRTGAVVSRMPPAGTYALSPATIAAAAAAALRAQRAGGSSASTSSATDDAAQMGEGPGGAVDTAGAAGVTASGGLGGDDASGLSVVEQHGSGAVDAATTPVRHTAGLSSLGGGAGSSSTAASLRDIQEAMHSVSYVRYDEGSGVLATGNQDGVIHLWQQCC